MGSSRVSRGTESDWRAPSCVLFDLDGTLLDSASGVLESLTTALRGVDAKLPADGVLRTLIGPPMHESLRTVVGLDGPRATEALHLYRTAYAEHGAAMSALFDGVPALLAAVSEANIPVGIATSKVEDQAVRLLEMHGVSRYVQHASGLSEAMGRTTKSQVIEHCLAGLSGRGIDVRRPLMVGDRAYDIASAATLGVPAIFVEWGYGSPEEAAGAVASATSPADLLRLLTGHTSSRTQGELA